MEYDTVIETHIRTYIMKMNNKNNSVPSRVRSVHQRKLDTRAMVAMDKDIWMSVAAAMLNLSE